ncbi:MAG: hypothetical protein H6865_06865 [Rhodospirillales bacterium]|nr:hypothetical protein [Alphaproteobacteria bacterium]MCB9987337.1 hypothetical protein [Rhodospirillales bacterium]USO07810.1 MAG: hypothetical protein H6866_00835 [Rhodospirillales bacterium]
MNVKDKLSGSSIRNALIAAVVFLLLFIIVSQAFNGRYQIAGGDQTYAVLDTKSGEVVTCLWPWFIGRGEKDICARRNPMKQINN